MLTQCALHVSQFISFKVSIHINSWASFRDRAHTNARAGEHMHKHTLTQVIKTPSNENLFLKLVNMSIWCFHMLQDIS